MSTDRFNGRLPAGLLYDPATDMWVADNGDGSVTVGATDFGLWLAGEIIAFTCKPRGAEVAAGRGLGTIESSKTVVSVRSPVGLRLTAANEAAEVKPALVNRDPYGEGWMARGEALDWAADSACLVDAAAYRIHCLNAAPDARVEVLAPPLQKLAILLWSVGPERPELCAAPFVYATTAAALDCQVEIHFSGRAVRLLVAGVADGLATGEGPACVYDFMRQASGVGVRFLACAMALKAHVPPDEALIAEYAGTAGAAAFVQRCLDPQWRTLVF